MGEPFPCGLRRQLDLPEPYVYFVGTVGFVCGFIGGFVGDAAKRGFNNIFAKEIVAINLNALNAFEDGAVVDQAALVEAGIIKSACDGVKVLSNGALTKKVTVKANAFSEAAKAKIEAAGGKAEVI